MREFVSNVAQNRCADLFCSDFGNGRAMYASHLSRKGDLITASPVKS